MVLSHLAVRLSCVTASFATLWYEQLADTWREPGKPPLAWPVLATDDERWDARAAIDAIVADGYGQNRDQYAHVLSTFKHAAYPKAPELCLAMFDELKTIGIDAFAKNHDPYWDIPLNENLPGPVSDLPIPQNASAAGDVDLFGDEAEFSAKRSKSTRRKKAK